METSHIVYVEQLEPCSCCKYYGIHMNRPCHLLAIVKNVSYYYSIPRKEPESVVKGSQVKVGSALTVLYKAVYLYSLLYMWL